MQEYWVACVTYSGLKVGKLEVTKETPKMVHIVGPSRGLVGYLSVLRKDDPRLQPSKVDALRFLKGKKESYRDHLIESLIGVHSTIKAIDCQIFLATDAQPDEVVIEETTATGCGEGSGDGDNEQS